MASAMSKAIKLPPQQSFMAHLESPSDLLTVIAHIEDKDANNPQSWLNNPIFNSMHESLIEQSDPSKNNHLPHQYAALLVHILNSEYGQTNTCAAAKAVIKKHKEQDIVEAFDIDKTIRKDFFTRQQQNAPEKDKRE
jgi:hypothetical protein